MTSSSPVKMDVKYGCWISLRKRNWKQIQLHHRKDVHTHVLMLNYLTILVLIPLWSMKWETINVPQRYKLRNTFLCTLEATFGWICKFPSLLRFWLLYWDMKHEFVIFNQKIVWKYISNVQHFYKKQCNYKKFFVMNLIRNYFQLNVDNSTIIQIWMYFKIKSWKTHVILLGQ